MPDPQTPNLQLYQPARGADPGTWDVPVNYNAGALDAALGQTTTVAITNVNVTLSPAQYACGTIVFTGTQTADVTITFPAFGRMYNIFNNCVNNNTWIMNLGVAAGVVCAPPGELTTVYTDGVNFFYLGMGIVGTYVDYAVQTVPRWITSCTIPPFLHCDGSTFSAVTYPVLNSCLGGNTLPDTRGRFRATLNEGTGRLTGTSGTYGLNGQVFLYEGGNENIRYQNFEGGLYHSHTPKGGGSFIKYNGYVGVAAGGDFSVVQGGLAATLTSSEQISTGSAGAAYAPPSYVGGLTFVRAG